jgi:hypothetical protein
MAQRKSPPSGRPSGTRPTGSKPGSKPAASKPASGARTNLTKTPVGRPAVRKPPPRKGKSIVNQKQTPWGMIISTVVVVLFAVAVVVVVVATSGKDKKDNAKGDPAYTRPELAAAKQIQGLIYHVEPDHTHKEGVVKYDTTPPTGGNHSQYWADCTGTVYDQPIANENAVHMLEHGAIWITYNADKVKGADLEELKKDVAGQDRLALSPYPNLKSAVSLQAWNYQLFVDSVSDPRIAQFISVLKYNKSITPEYGATCSQPTFKQQPSTFGHPLWQPASGSGGNTMGS